MILLDTNVVSEPLRPAPDARVIEWIDAQVLETLFLSAITVAELRAGLALLPAGKRRTGLQFGSTRPSARQAEKSAPIKQGGAREARRCAMLMPSRPVRPRHVHTRARP